MRPYVVTVRSPDQDIIFGMMGNSPKEVKFYARNMYSHLGYIKSVRLHKEKNIPTEMAC